MFFNCNFGEDSWGSLGLQGDPTSQLSIFIGRTDAKAEAPVLWLPDVKNWLIGKDPDAEKHWRHEEKGMTEHDRIASLTQWTLGWASSRSWWWTGKPGVLQSMGSQRVGHHGVTELNWIPSSLFIPPPPSPFGNHKFAFFVYESVSV